MDVTLLYSPSVTTLYSSFADVALSLDLNSSLRSSLNSLLCALCRHSPKLFSLVVDRCQAAINGGRPEVPGLLHLLAHVAKSDVCTRELLTTELVHNLISWLHTTFLALRDKARTNDDRVSEEDVRLLLSKASAYLAFFTDLSQNSDPVQEWLGSAECVEFWYPMMEFLSLEPSFVSAFDISFCHDVTLSFFCTCLVNQQNKVLFTRLMCNILRGQYSAKEPASGEGGVETGGQNAGIPVLTTFIYKLIVNLVLREESVTVILQLDSQLPSPTLSLTKTTDAQEFHPSFPIGEHTYCLQLQSSCSLQQLETLCTKPGNTAPPSSGAKRLSSDMPQAWQVWEHNLRKFDLRCWKTGVENIAATKDVINKSKPLSLLFTAPQNGSTRAFLPPSTLVGQLMKSGGATAAGQLLLIAVVDSGQQMVTDACSSQRDQHPSLLDLFITCGGLEILAECLPALYSYNWPEPIGGVEEGRTQLAAASRFKPHVLLHLMPHILFHSVLMLGLGLKMEHFCRALKGNLPVATILLRMLLGAELTGKSMCLECSGVGWGGGGGSGVVG